MVFGTDNTIGVRPLPELIAAIRQPAHNAQLYPRLKELSGGWKVAPKRQQITSSQLGGGAALVDLPEDRPDYYFETDVVFGDARAPVSVTVRSTAAQDSGYRVALRPDDSIFEITEHSGERRSYLSEKHVFGKTARLKIFVCDGQLEAFADGRADLSTRVLQKTNSKIILDTNDRNAAFHKPLVHYFKQQQRARFRLNLESQQPVFSAAPGQTRMATCYRDRQGVYHLFADYMTGARISWTAEIRHYRSRNLRHWEFVETAVRKGKGDAPDAYGAASPHVLATDERIYLFYAGRANPVGGKADLRAPRGQPGYVAGRILLASAEADEHGAPAEPFEKQGAILEPGDGWDSMRLDDPCAVLDNGTVHLFFKGFDDNRQRDRVQAGYATARLADMKFTKHPAPILSVPGGGEMPRVFRQAGRWHLFYHHFGSGRWHHHRSDNSRDWQLADAEFFNGHTLGGPRDIMMIYGIHGQLLEEPRMLVAGTEDGYNKLWLYRLVETGRQPLKSEK